MKRGLLLLITWALILTAATAGAAEKREVPNYDGREDPPATLGESLLWVPRLTLFPAWLATEYLVRKPLGATLTWLERDNIPQKVTSALTFSEGDSGVYPTALIGSGMRPSVGLYFWSNGVLTEADRMRLHLSWGGNDWYRVSLRERIALGGAQQDNVPFAGDQISFSALVDQRPDYLFYGLGPDAPDEPARFLMRRIGADTDLELTFGQHLGVSVGAGIHGYKFGRGDPDDDEIHLVDHPDAPAFAPYSLGSLQAGAVLDTRSQRPGPGTGVRLELKGELLVDPAFDGLAFGRASIDAGVALDLGRDNRTLALRQRLIFVENFGSAAIPFTELASLGGNDLLRGFNEGRYRGESAAVTTLQYTWPIWVALDGMLFAEVGNVFGSGLDGFDPSQFAGSFGTGIRTSTDRDVSLQLFVAAGTRRFDEGPFAVENVRVVLGAVTGF